MKIGIVMSILFTILGVLEIEVNAVNAFVLFVVALVYLRGYWRGKSFIYAASLIAFVFALISILALIASFVNCLVLDEPIKWVFDYSLAGVATLPLLKMKP